MAGIDAILGASVDAVKRSGAIEGGALMATVSVVNTDGTVDVTRAGDVYPSVRVLSGYPAPLVGDAIEMLRSVGGWVCLGAFQSTTPSWTPISLATGWTVYGTPYYAPAYRVNPDGTAQLCGLALHAGATAPSTVCTLPAEARPASKVRFVGEVATSLFGFVDVNPSGTVQIGDYAGTNTGKWCPFDVVRYRLR